MNGGFVSLSDKDLEKIGQVVDDKITREIGSLRLEMNHRFDATDKKIDGVEERLTAKIEQVK